MPRHLPAIAALAWLAAAVTALWLWYYPFSPDSYAYVAAAISLMDTGELTLPFASASATSLPAPFTGWPPGMPLIVALAAWIVRDPWLAARIVSLVAMAIALWTWHQATRGERGGTASLVTLFACSTTAVVAFTAWSEGPFMACTIACWLSLSAWIRSSHRQVRMLVIAGMLVGLAAGFRYAGLFLVPAYLYLTWRHGMRMERATGIMTLIVALLPTAAWFVRNQSLSQDWRGWSMPVPAAWRAPAELCQAVGDLTIFGWLAEPRLQAVAGAVLMLVFVVILIRCKRRGHLPTGVHSALAFAVPLLLGPMIARSLGWSGFVNARLIWPALPFAALALFGALEPSVRARRILVWCAVLYLGAQSATALRIPALHPRWEAAVQSLGLPTDMLADTHLLANRGWVVWQTTGRPCYVMPLRYRGEPELDPDSLAAWAQRRNVAFALWLDEGRSPEDYARIYGPIAATMQRGDTALVRPVWTTTGATLFRLVEGH